MIAIGQTSSMENRTYAGYAILLEGPASRVDSIVISWAIVTKIARVIRGSPKTRPEYFIRMVFTFAALFYFLFAKKWSFKKVKKDHRFIIGNLRVRLCARNGR